MSDAKSLSAVFRQSWRQAYLGIIPQLELENLIRRRSLEWWKSAARSGDDLLVIELAGKIAGYATLGSCRLRGEHQGEIYELYLSPEHQGLGLGEHLFEGCRAHLDGRMRKGLVVWALADNTTATGFYWRRGGRPIAKAVERFGPARLEKIAFAWD